LRLLESRRSAILKLKNREVAEEGLATFRHQFEKASEEFSKAVTSDIEFLIEAYKQRDKLCHVFIENVSINAQSVLASYEADNAGLHWKTRRSGYWGYMYDLQSRVANKIFPSVAKMLGGYTDELNSYVDKFKIHLDELSSASTRIATVLDLDAEISFDLATRLDGALLEMLESTQALVESEEQKIANLLEEFVTEDVEERISAARVKVSSVWGKGTTFAQTTEVRNFYKEVKSILGEALTSHLEIRRLKFVETLKGAATTLPDRALSEARAELTQAQDSIRAAAESALDGRKDAFMQLANEVETCIDVSLHVAERIFLDEPLESMKKSDLATPSPSNDDLLSNNFQPVGHPISPEPKNTEQDAGLYPDWARKAKGAATKLITRFELSDGSNKWPWRRLFESRFLEGSERCLIIEPYISKSHQFRNLLEFMNRIIEVTDLKELRIVTGDEIQGFPGDDSSLRELANQLLKDKNIDLNWDRDIKSHDRFAIFDNGAVFKLGRGLDIYKPSTGLARTDSSLRKVRQCEIDVFGPPDKW
jgi:hypothetical protein